MIEREPDFTFRRPTWQWGLALFTPVWFLVPMLRAQLVRVVIAGDEVVIERGGDRGERRIARTDVREIRLTRRDLTIVTRDGARETLTPGGKPHRAAIALARQLAFWLAVPFREGSVAAVRLPVARVVRVTT